ncbi:hypothetical protein P7228_09060 [Altererythrobacter arenosus]|uniref:Uncharacterized protein n=1 Tax=Altererythrobacter arenosus TaxID=3032592 RepID=A0ABY8FMA0_9SPHN|nr:hypothetical protein [Altererythrobacter sp. CAU 1644]WFL76151.1 hypothetical protein P7228_09060 [Altererythrobacter sp. CAU 1644]
MTSSDRLMALIPACIVEGITKGPLITLALTLIGYNKRHVGMTLNDGNLGKIDSCPWFRDAQGRYRLAAD